jgi:hypothetical protein
MRLHYGVNLFDFTREFLTKMFHQVFHAS